MHISDWSSDVCSSDLHACCVFIRREIDAGIVPALVCRLQRIEKQPGAFQRAAIQLNVRFQNDPLIIGYRGQGRGTEVMIQDARAGGWCLDETAIRRSGMAANSLDERRGAVPCPTARPRTEERRVGKAGVSELRIRG